MRHQARSQQAILAYHAGHHHAGNVPGLRRAHQAQPVRLAHCMRGVLPDRFPREGDQVVHQALPGADGLEAGSNPGNPFTGMVTSVHPILLGAMLGALVVKKVSVVRHQFAVQVQWWVFRQLFELLGRSWHWLRRQIQKLFGFEEQLPVAASSTVTAPVSGHPAAATLSSEPKGKEAASSSSGPAGATRPPTF